MLLLLHWDLWFQNNWILRDFLFFDLRNFCGFLQGIWKQKNYPKSTFRSCFEWKLTGIENTVLFPEDGRKCD